MHEFPGKWDDDQPIHISADKEWQNLKDCSILPVGLSNGNLFENTQRNMDWKNCTEQTEDS
jgi:hypothetical protein